MKKIGLLFGLLYSFVSYGQTAHQLLRSGNSDYNGKHYSDAEIDYRKALEANPNSVKGTYNLGNAIYNQAATIKDENIKKGRYDEAARQFEDAAATAKNDALKSDAFYNLGNARLMNKEYDKSIEAYKQALRLNPKDEDAKHNLSYALKQYKQQQQQQQKQDKKDEKKDEEKDKKEQDKQNEQDKKDEEKKDDKKDQKQDQQQQKDKKQQQEQKPEEKRLEKQELSKEDAKRLLKIMENEEQKVQEKMRRGTGKKVKPEKEW